MARDTTKKAQAIADNIRKMLFNIDLRLTYAEGEYRTALEDFNLYSHLGKRSSKRALLAKARSECYKVYAKNLRKTRDDMSRKVNSILDNYNPKYKRIWVMYFLEQASIETIGSATHYTTDNVKKVIGRLKSDLIRRGV